MVKNVATILSISIGMCLLASCSSSTDASQSSAGPASNVSLPTSSGVQSQCAGYFSMDSPGSFTENSPEITSDGSGLILRLTVVDPDVCLPLKGIEIDVWHNGNGENYTSVWRSKQYSDASGVVKYETVFPSAGERTPHIHIRGVYKGSLYWWVVMLDEPVSKDPLNLDVTLVLASVRAFTTTTVPSGLNY